MKIYISGKMRGLPEEESRELFKSAENYLIELGHDVINPWDSEDEKNEKCRDWDDYILYDLQILKTCDAIFMLSNWQDSDGAKCEHAFASGRHMKIIYEEQIKSLLYHNAIIKQSAIIDSQPKNICFPVPKGEEYKHMCMSLAQGYEIDWVDHYAEIMVNEFGKPESFDSFKKRHPNFAEDIKNAFLNH